MGNKVSRKMNGPVALVFWYLPDCDHGQTMAPVIEAFAKARKIPLTLIDMVEFDAVAEKYQVDICPTVSLLNFGKEINRTVPQSVEDLERLMILDQTSP